MAAAAKLPPDRHEGALPKGSMVSAYRVERLLGSGGMGWVYQAMHVLEARPVALKVLREDQLRQDRAIDRMMREAQILATVPHGGIPTFYECGLLPDGRPWIAMELIEGMPLSTQIADGSLDHDRVLAIVGDVAGVLAAAHQRGVTHRDLKPDNILLTPTSSTYPLRVIDWGIAHQVAGARYTHHDEAIGTPTYMAPEQARGGPSEGHCDIYGLGVVAYQALAGRPPFVGKSSVDILVQHMNKPVPPLAPRCPEAPVGLVELVERMLIKNYIERPTAEDVLDEIDTLRTSGNAVPTYMVWSDEGTAPRPRVELDAQTPRTTPMRPSLLGHDD